MRFLYLLLCITLCTSNVFANPTKDLQLLVKPKGNPVIVVGDSMELEMRLRNGSSQPIAVVKPGDGSESGWREPNLYFSAEKKTVRGWTSVERLPIGRCGLFDARWQKDVVILEPGEEIDVAVWMPPPSSYFSLTAGTYRFRLHYEYTQGETGKSHLGAVAEIPPLLVGRASFSVVSEPFVYTLEEKDQ